MVDPIFTRLHTDLGTDFENSILKTVQFAKDPSGATHGAILAVRAYTTFMLSGIFLPNKWYEIYGAMDFLPGHPFRSLHLFKTSIRREEVRPVPKPFPFEAEPPGQVPSSHRGFTPRQPAQAPWNGPEAF